MMMWGMNKDWFIYPLEGYVEKNIRYDVEIYYENFLVIFLADRFYW